MPKATLTFIRWDRPALDGAVDFLTQGSSGGPLDLRETLIIVPTRHAGRRLRERLAMTAAARGTAVLMGPVETPPSLFTPPPSPAPLATGTAADIFWRRTWESATPELLGNLGRGAVSTDAAVRAAAANRIRTLRDQLGEECESLMSFADKVAAKQSNDAVRWHALAELEKSYTALVASAGWRDDVPEKLSAAANPVLPPGIRRVAVIFVPDPPPLALRALGHVSRIMTVDICVHAPESRHREFDEWGRPLAARWSKVPLSLDPAHVEVCDNAITVAERIREIISGLHADQRRHAVAGVADPRTAARIQMALARDGISTFDPGGTPAAQCAIFNLVERLMRLRRDPGIDVLIELIRHPYALHRLTKDIPAPLSLLTLMDDFLNRHMPVSLDDAIALAPAYSPQPDWLTPDDKNARRLALVALFHAIREWMQELNAGPLSIHLPELLAMITDGLVIDDDFQREARIFTDTADRLAKLEPLCRDNDEAGEVLRSLIDAQTLTTRRRAEDIDLLGWLELAWEDAPLLLLADLNDGMIPDAVTADAFLPDHARAMLGLRDNQHRLARDAYILEVLTQSRPPGQLRGFLARTSGSGDVLKPSRLLFMGPSGDLPRRALHFFSEGRTAFVSTDRTPAWRLRTPSPDALAGAKSLSASRMRTYLECPFRFYLKMAGRLGDPFERKQELDFMDFGHVVHEIMHRFALGPCATAQDAGVIEEFLLNELERLIAVRFGPHPGLPIVMQRDVIHQRLRYAAAVQAAWRGHGWVIDARHCELPGKIPLGGDVVNFRIDRIDVNEKTGEVCVIDYKTSSDAKNPAKTHLKTFKSGVPAAMAFAAAPLADTRWIDVQLPLYAAAARALYPNRHGPVRAAYFALPKAVTDTAMLMWKDFDDALVDSALDCARRIFERMRAGVFWPPAEEFGDRDNAYLLFFDSIREHLDAASVAALEHAANAYAEAAR